MNNHDCANASVPFPDIAVTNAGPNDLAGFTDVPVKVIPNKWTTVNARPIINPAIDESFSSEVAPNTV